MYTLVDNYLNLIETDEFIRMVKTELGLERFKNTYYLFSGSRLLDSIVDKADKIDETVRQINSLDDIESFGDPQT
jgi:hypothetical protein